MNKEEILLEALNTYGKFTSVEQEFNENQLEVIYEAMEIVKNNVVGRSEQLADHKCIPMVNADWTYLRCECGKRFEPKG